MSEKKIEAEKALKALLWELPAEFSGPLGERTRPGFSVLGTTNVRKVHRSLETLQRYFGLLEEESDH